MTNLELARDALTMHPLLAQEIRSFLAHRAENPCPIPSIEVTDESLVRMAISSWLGVVNLSDLAAAVMHDPDCGPLCVEHGDMRDNSVDYARLEVAR